MVKAKPSKKCSYPLADTGFVRRIYSELPNLACTLQGFKLIYKVNGLEPVELEKLLAIQSQFNQMPIANFWRFL